MKYTNEEYSLDADEYEKIQNRMVQFQKETGAKEAIHITLICGNGYKQSKYSGIVQILSLGMICSITDKIKKTPPPVSADGGVIFILSHQVSSYSVQDMINQPV